MMLHTTARPFAEGEPTSMVKKRKGRPRKEDQCATDIEVSHLYSIDLAGIPGSEAKTARYACDYAAFRIPISLVA